MDKNRGKCVLLLQKYRKFSFTSQILDKPTLHESLNIYKLYQNGLKS